MIEDIKFAMSVGKEVTYEEIGNELHVVCKGVFYFVFPQEEASEVIEVIDPKVEENTRFGSFEKKVLYKGINVTIKTNFYEYKKTIMADSHECYTYTKTNNEEDLLKTHYRKMKKKGLVK